ncbi:hypothetical protein [Vibrio crassostreae]|uniref:hypothetical protein n=1 Tax=Vibrio crassostreae TaxID=246167 RepID=UPI001B317E92|nr:hypothetical protein [Vibrio crassostreae]
MSVQVSSLQVKSLAKNLRKTMTYGYVSQLLQEVVGNPKLVEQINSAVGKKHDKPIKQSSADKLIGAACGFDNFESALNTRAVKRAQAIKGDEALVERLNSWEPPKNRVVFMEQNLSLFMGTFRGLSEHQAIQLLLNDHFLFFDDENMYLSTNPSKHGSDNHTSGVIAMHSRTDVRDENVVTGLIGSLSNTVFKVMGCWAVFDVSKSLPKGSNYMINTIGNIKGFLECAADGFVCTPDDNLLWFRSGDKYEASFQKLRSLLKKEPLSPVFSWDDVIQNSTVYTTLEAAIEATEGTGRILYDEWDEKFLQLAALFLSGDDDALFITRQINLSQPEKDLMVRNGVLEKSPLNDDKPFWQVGYHLTLTEDNDFEVSISETPELYQWGWLVNYDKWVDGCTYSPRAAKVIWDDLNSLLPKIDGDMKVVNEAEVISKVALVTTNRTS